ITGMVELENRNGAVTVEDVSDSVIINNRYSNTTAKNVGGDLRIETRNGSVDVSGIKGSASIVNAFAPINVQNIQGDLTISGRNNGVDVRHVEGDIRTDSSFQNVTIQDPLGAVTVTSRNGDLLLSFERPPVKNVSIASRFSNVTLELPSSSAFAIDAHTEFGEVESDFQGLTINRSNREKSINGDVSRGGPRLTISTRNGAIRIQKRG